MHDLLSTSRYACAQRFMTCPALVPSMARDDRMHDFGLRPDNEFGPRPQ
jgi:hypothetical protein